MTAEAVLLVLAAAVAHALWNLQVKRAAHAGIAFMWLCTAVSALIWAPPAAWLMATSEVTLGWRQGVFVVGSVLVHTLYFGLLQRGYQVGDLSVVYPVARGLGPVLSIAGAVWILGERPSAQTAVGGLAVGAAVTMFGLTGRAEESSGSRVTRGIGYAVLTGVCIAGYTLWDAYAVTRLAIPPLLFNWIGSLVRLAVLTPVMRRRLTLVPAVWREHRGAVLAVAILSPAAYLLVLIAFTLAPVSHVAPLRELSIVIGTALGARFLAEGHAWVRISLAAGVLVGVALVVTG
jgi:drug/metabolite transporter (DMT)-like permease